MPRLATLRIAPLVVLVVVLASCGNSPSRPITGDEPPWVLRDNMANIAVLLVDYDTWAFLGAHMSHHSSCGGCDSTALPFAITFKYPTDLGWIALTYTETGDTVFYATVVWNGEGSIWYPHAWLLPEEFETTGQGIALPDSVDYLSWSEPFTPSGEYLEAAGQAWDSVKSLDIVEAFATDDYRVAFLPYNPAWGTHDPPSNARWVIFLYREGG